MRIFLKIFGEDFLDALVDDNFMALASLLFLDPKSAFDLFFLIQEMTDFQLKQIRNA